MSGQRRAPRTWRARDGGAYGPRPDGSRGRIVHARAVPFCSIPHTLLLVDGVDLVLAGYPFCKPLFIGLPGDAMRRLDLAPQPLPLAGGDAGRICGQPAPLPPGDALELPPGACDAIPVHLAVSGSEPSMNI